MAITTESSILDGKASCETGVSSVGLPTPEVLPALLVNALGVFSYCLIVAPDSEKPAVLWHLGDCAKVLGLTETQILDSGGVGHWVISEDKHRLRERDVIEARGQESLVEVRLRIGQEDHWVRERGFPLGPVDERGMVAIVRVIEEITVKKKFELQLADSQKMESLGLLAGGVAHDFNNILAGIVGLADVTRIDVDEDSDTAQNMEQILMACNRARHLVGQILSFSRHSTELKTPLDLKPVVEESVALIRASLPSTVELDKRLDSEVPLVMADGVKIHEVIMNLCTNSAHAMKERGRLRIALYPAVVHQETQTVNGFMLPGRYAVIEIGDNGVGIPKDQILQIFEPFFTTKAPGEGTGMGCWVSLGIITGHDGHLIVNSEVGRGTTMFIYFPQTLLTMDEPRVLNEETPRGTGHVLLVDDEPQIVSAASRLLGSIGYTTSSFTSPVDAFAAFEQNPDKFDLLLTDQTMPVLTGVDLAGRVMAKRRDMPVVLCTGYSKNVDEQVARKAGIDVFCLKPLRKAELARAVWRAIHRSEKKWA